MKIRKITRDGPIEVRHIMGQKDYEDTCEEWRKELLLELPSWESLLRAKWGFEDMRVFTEVLAVLIEVVHKDTVYIYQYIFTPEFITDFASVPKGIARAIVDNDEKWVLLPSLVHDAEFASQWHDFKSTNTLFWKMAVYEVKRIAKEHIRRETGRLRELQEFKKDCINRRAERAVRKEIRRAKRAIRKLKRGRAFDLAAAFFAYVAVSTPTGKRRWGKDRPYWQKRGCTFQCIGEGPVS